MENYLTNYNLYLQKEIDECFIKLESIEINSYEMPFNFAFNLKSRLQELKEINEKYPLLNKFFKFLFSN